MTETSTAVAKALLRTEIREARAIRPVSAELSVRLSQQLGQYCLDHGVRVAAAYLPLATEPDLSEFLDWARGQSITLLLPNVRGADLSWVVFESETRIGELGFKEATGKPAKLSTADVVFLPALAADLNGNRLGQGKGFYDRTLSEIGTARNRPKLVAVLFDDELRLSLPVEAHDQKIDAVVTASKFVWFGR